MANSRYQQGIVKSYYENRDTMSLQKLGEIASDLFLCDSPKKLDQLWKRAAKALPHTGAQADVYEPIVAKRDLAGLTRLVNQLVAPDRRPSDSSATATPATPTPPTHPPAAQSTAASPPVDPLDKQVLKAALKAFRKRLKLTRLDEESKLGVGPLTGGKQLGDLAITPPNQYPAAVWEELAKQGRIKRAGTGFYSLVQT